MEEQKTLFRKKSLDRISSPEQLQDYMRVTNPGIWMVLVAVIALLVGLLVCSVVGRIETKIAVECDAEQGTITVAMPPQEGEKVEPGMVLRIADREVPIEYVFQSEEDKFIATAKSDLEDGVYDGTIVTESISPISFLLNEKD